MKRRWAVCSLGMLAALSAAPVNAEDLFQGQAWASVASDQKASAVGDALTVIVYQSAEARNAAANRSQTRRSFSGSVSGGSVDEQAALSLDGSYAGNGEVRRSESFVTQISVVVESITSNGDLCIAGSQRMHINGEDTIVRIRGRIRPSDIGPDNSVLSTRIADAQISYDGRGFVSRNARPNFIHRLFSLLGLGG